MKVLVCGSRGFNNYTKMYNTLTMFININYIISGGASGADSMAEQFADDVGIEKKIILPNWETYGKSAGYIRNSQMLDENPDLVIAFWDGVSRGTKDTLNKAKAKRIATLIVYD